MVARSTAILLLLLAFVCASAAPLRGAVFEKGAPSPSGTQVPSEHRCAAQSPCSLAARHTLMFAEAGSSHAHGHPRAGWVHLQLLQIVQQDSCSYMIVHDNLFDCAATAGGSRQERCCSSCWTCR